MNWDELEVIWRRQQPPLGAAADVADLVRSFETRHRKQAAALLIRDWSEAGAGLLVAAVFVPLAAHLGWAGWPVWIAVLLILGVSGFFVRERLRARRLRPEPGLCMLAKIDADLAELRRQRRLLRGVATWYLAPIGAAIALVMFALSANAPPENPRRDPVFIAGMAAFQVAMLVFAWAINRRAVRRQIDPRVAELEILRTHFPHSEKSP